MGNAIALAILAVVALLLVLQYARKRDAERKANIKRRLEGR